MMIAPPGSKQLTSDGEIYKVVLQKGGNNHSSLYNDTAVAVDFKIFGEGGEEILHTDESLVWIIGDNEYEDQIYPFLRVAVRSMTEKEVARFYFTNRYMLGSSPIISPDGKKDTSSFFQAIIHLRKSQPLDEISLEGEPSKKVFEVVESKPKQEEKPIEKELTPEEVELQKRELFKKQTQFALYQLQMATAILKSGKPASARKEFNRARIAWTPQVNLNKAPNNIDVDDLGMTEDEIKKYVESRALYGVAQTYMAIDPPNEEKAISSLRESVEFDPKFIDSVNLLKKLGVELENEPDFPPFDDPRLLKPQFWQNNDLPFEKRVEYNSQCHSEANILFKSGEFKEALKLYNRCQIIFTGQQSNEKLKEGQKIQVDDYLIHSRLNAIACYLELSQYKQMFSNIDMLIHIIKKTGRPYNKQILKCLFKKTMAYIKMNSLNEAKNVLTQMREVPDSAVPVQELANRINQVELSNQKEEDFIYKKMTGTV